MTTHTLTLADVDLAYDVHGPLPTADGQAPLLLIGQPMDASGFRALLARLPERTVITPDPRGVGRSVRRDGRDDYDPEVQARDLHALIATLGGGPFDMLGSSGGAVVALALVAAHPHALRTLVAHEPPLLSLLPDAAAAARAQKRTRDTYLEHGPGPGMADFIAMTAWSGPFTEAYFEQPPPDPAAFGLSTVDDGRRDDPLLSDRSWAVSRYRPDFEALTAAPTRIVIAVGEESDGVFTGRAAVATADALGQRATVFPSHHGGFLDGEFGYAGQPDAFASRLREVLDADPALA
jgi:pimeloyl-ACP methyl ester carboxylesterase